MANAFAARRAARPFWTDYPQERRHLPCTGAKAYLRDNPEAELHLLDSGHFALEDKGSEIAALMRDFLDRKLH